MTSTQPAAGSPGHILNTKPHPRILIKLSDDELMARWSFLSEGGWEGTYRQIEDFSEVDPTEWDAVITDGPVAQRGLSYTGNGYKYYDQQIVPENLYAFVIFDTVKNGPYYLDLFPDVQGGDRQMKLHTEIAGSQLRKSDAKLTENLADLVKDFTAVADARDYQFGVKVHAADDCVDNPPYRSFVTGPADVSLMGSYRKAHGVGVWLMPLDVADFEPWWVEALREWHSYNSTNFPGYPGWIERDEWRSHAENQILRRIQAENERFAALCEEHEAASKELMSDLEKASAEDAPLKQLLIGSGIPLQDVVRDVLRDLGLQVRDMDKEFPEREPREDFRITDIDDPGWLALGDATGVGKGAKGVKLQTLGNYVIQYLAEEGNAIIPKQWLIVNRLIDRDPAQRGRDIYRSDVLRPFEAAGGLVIDTPALFVLHRAVQGGLVDKAEIRNYLRNQVGELSTDDAEDWLRSR